MEALGGRGGIAHTHSSPQHQMGVSDQRHVTAALYPPGKGPPVPIGQEDGWAPALMWTQRLEEKSFCLCRGSNPDRPVVQSVTQTSYELKARAFSVLGIFKRHLQFPLTVPYEKSMWICIFFLVTFYTSSHSWIRYLEIRVSVITDHHQTHFM
jgi:hypothetical protein